MRQGEAIRERLRARPVMRVSDLLSGGITRSALHDAAARGDLIRLSYGVVGAPGTDGLDRIDDAVACLVTGGVICGRSAAMRHGLSDDNPEGIELLVSADGAGKAPTAFPSRLRRTSDPVALALGVETVEIGGIPVRMTGRARTVVDQYRFGVPEQHLLQALHTYLGEGGTGNALHALCIRLSPGIWDTMQRDIANVGLADARAYTKEAADGDDRDEPGDDDAPGSGFGP